MVLMQMASLQIRSLKVFCDVVRRRSFSQAASDHGMTQSAASQTVQGIEEFLAVQLIDRSKRPFVLTAEGQRFYDGLTNVLRQFDGLVNEIRQVSDEVNGQVAIASIYSVGLSYLPAIEERFSEGFPQSTHVIQLAHPHEVYRMVEQGTVDFGLISYPEASKSILATHWRDEPMILIASPRHRLANATGVSPADLSSHAMVAFAPQLRIRQEIDRYLRNQGVGMRVVIELDNIDSVKHAVMVNSGLAIVPEPTVSAELATGAVKALHSPWMKLTRPLGVIQRRNVGPSRSARAFLELLLQDGSAQGSKTRIEPEKPVQESGELPDQLGEDRPGAARSGAERPGAERPDKGATSAAHRSVASVGT
jgi:DNA-binding transcriptional LysR family regulator